MSDLEGEDSTGTIIVSKKRTKFFVFITEAAPSARRYAKEPIFGIFFFIGPYRAYMQRNIFVLIREFNLHGSALLYTTGFNFNHARRA